MSAGKTRRGSKRTRNGIRSDSSDGGASTKADDRAVGDSAKRILHCRIGVYWPDDDRYYRGVIVNYKDDDGYNIQYDDGDREWLRLKSEKFRWYGPRAASGQPPYTNGMRELMLDLGAQNAAAADSAPEAPPLPPGGAPTREGAVGWRLGLYWPGAGAFFNAEVLSFDAAAGRHHLLFDDGEVEWADLAQECVRWDSRVRGSHSQVAAGLEGANQVAPKGKAAVGWRVAVYFAKQRLFREGEITGYDSATGKHRVMFDSASDEWVSLTSRKLVWRVPPGLQGHIIPSPEVPAETPADTPAGKPAEKPAEKRAPATAPQPPAAAPAAPAAPAPTVAQKAPAAPARAQTPAAVQPPRSTPQPANDTPPKLSTLPPPMLATLPPAAGGVKGALPVAKAAPLSPQAAAAAAKATIAAARVVAAAGKVTLNLPKVVGPPPLPAKPPAPAADAAGKAPPPQVVAARGRLRNRVLTPNGVRASTSVSGDEAAAKASAERADQASRSPADAAKPPVTSAPPRAAAAAPALQSVPATAAPAAAPARASAAAPPPATPATTASSAAPGDATHAAAAAKSKSLKSFYTPDDGAVRVPSVRKSPEVDRAVGGPPPCPLPPALARDSKRACVTPAPRSTPTRPNAPRAESDDDDDDDDFEMLSTTVVEVPPPSEAAVFPELSFDARGLDLFAGARIKYADELAKDLDDFDGDVASLISATRARMEHIQHCLRALERTDRGGATEQSSLSGTLSCLSPRTADKAPAAVPAAAPEPPKPAAPGASDGAAAAATVMSPPPPRPPAGATPPRASTPESAAAVAGAAAPTASQPVGAVAAKDTAPASAAAAASAAEQRAEPPADDRPSATPLAAGCQPPQQPAAAPSAPAPATAAGAAAEGGAGAPRPGQLASAASSASQSVDENADDARVSTAGGPQALQPRVALGQSTQQAAAPVQDAASDSEHDAKAPAAAPSPSRSVPVAVAPPEEGVPASSRDFDDDEPPAKRVCTGDVGKPASGEAAAAVVGREPLEPAAEGPPATGSGGAAADGQKDAEQKRHAAAEALLLEVVKDPQRLASLSALLAKSEAHQAVLSAAQSLTLHVSAAAAQQQQLQQQGARSDGATSASASRAAPDEPAVARKARGALDSHHAALSLAANGNAASTARGEGGGGRAGVLRPGRRPAAGTRARAVPRQRRRCRTRRPSWRAAWRRALESWR